MNPSGYNVIGVDLGGTNIVSLLVNREGKIISKDKRETLAKEGKEKTINQLVNSVKTVIKEGEKRGTTFESILGLGIGAPGPLNIKKGVVYLAPHLPDWRNVHLTKILRGKLELSVFLENDANAAALGEWWKGAGRNIDNLVLLTLGTGIGGGIIINGEVLHGSCDIAGEIGHIIIHEEGLPCSCGSRGCLEAYASATGVVRRTIAALKEGRKSILIDWVSGNLEKINCELVYQAAKENDKLSQWIIEETARYLGIGITNIVNILNPEMVILSGGMSQAGDLILKPVRKYAKRYALKPAIERVKIVQGSLLEDAGAIGAAITVLKRKNLVVWYDVK
ncbi:MAG: ROK family glucokinase [Candidatus Aerophobetes bacterium]|nr:ROK family glucokinase [Candidatus Aerophobetes bacterium]